MSAASSISNGIGSTSQKNILIGCTGSVASLKIPEIVNKLLKHGNFCVKVVATERAKHFFKREDIPETELLSDIDEWTAWNCRGDPVVHIELVKWADLFVIAPLDANTLGKLSSVSNYPSYSKISETHFVSQSILIILNICQY